MRGLNFKYLQSYPISIENFDHNITDLVDNIYVGPQGELLENIDSFNSRYDINIDITKHFTLKPGGYDKIKKAYTEFILRWDMKPRGIKSIFDRVSQYGWRLSSFRTDLLGIERQMLNMRATGIAWQDNTENFNIELEKLRDIIITSLDNCKKMYPNVDISVKLLPCSGHNVHDSSRRRSHLSRETFPIITTTEEARDYILTFYIHIKDPTMTIHRLNIHNTVDKYDISCGDMIVASGTYLLPLISRNWGREAKRTDESTLRTTPLFLECMYLSEMNLNSHPYIATSTDKYMWDLDEEPSITNANICTGNMASDIKATLMNIQIEAHITHVVTWLTNFYIPQTNPLNRITALRRNGWNKLLSSFSRTLDNPIEWKECSLPPAIDRSMRAYAQGTNSHHNRYSYDSVVDVRSELFKDRKRAYLEHIKIEDLPCVECRHNQKCLSYVNMTLFLSSDKLTPMDEAYLGYFIEIDQYKFYRNVRERLRLTYAEEAMQFSDYHDPSHFYDRIIMANDCVKRWLEQDGLEISLNWANNIFNSRFYCLMNKGEPDLKVLHMEAMNPDSKFLWSVDTIEEFRRPLTIPETFEELLDRHPELREDSAETETVQIHEDLTAEEQTLRWATQLGGANNL